MAAHPSYKCKDFEEDPEVCVAGSGTNKEKKNSVADKFKHIKKTKSEIATDEIIDGIMKKLWAVGTIACSRVSTSDTALAGLMADGVIDMKENQIIFTPWAFHQRYNIYDFPTHVRLINTRGVKFITPESLEIDKDVVRFFMMTRKNDSQLDFDLVKVKEQSKDNPVFYVQYAHARAYSVFRKAQEMFGDDILENLTTANFDLLQDESEIALIRQLVEFPRQVELAAQVNEPHRIAYYLYELASGFHALWNKGRDDVQMRFLDEERKDVSSARLALIQAVCFVIASGLSIFGVQPVKEM
jgi:hypothetical protein